MKIEKGTKVTRILAGCPMELEITEVTDDTFNCGPWTFDKATGAEIDEQIGWGPPPLSTGSYIKELQPHHRN